MHLAPSVTTLLSASSVANRTWSSKQAPVSLHPSLSAAVSCSRSFSASSLCRNQHWGLTGDINYYFTEHQASQRYEGERPEATVMREISEANDRRRQAPLGPLEGSGGYCEASRRSESDRPETTVMRESLEVGDGIRRATMRPLEDRGSFREVHKREEESPDRTERHQGGADRTEQLEAKDGTVEEETIKEGRETTERRPAGQQDSDQGVKESRKDRVEMMTVGETDSPRPATVSYGQPTVRTCSTPGREQLEISEWPTVRASTPDRRKTTKIEVSPSALAKMMTDNPDLDRNLFSVTERLSSNDAGPGTGDAYRRSDRWEGPQYED